MKNLLLVISVATGALADTAQAQVERIQSLRFDRSQVQRIYLAPGLGSILLFPCGLVEIFVGRSEDLKAQISPNDKKTLFLNLKLNSSLPTNIIAKCESDRSVFVFDVIPSRNKHQDVVEIRNFYGRPHFAERSTVKTSENKSSRRLVVKARSLLDKGEVR
ncbi:MAG: hypothetical protein BroJett040_07980 [Oligoflexia bacterium]|nr:MAG: hypothetical protein BroJett040_07980 [Oligoflexia bacterium]